MVSSTQAPGTAALDVFVARQPILDRRQELYGYELLFRSGWENRYDAVDHEQASLSVIAHSFFVLGIDRLAGRGRSFVNFGRGTLLDEYAYALPKERLVVEILETVEPDDEVVAACERLKAAGYTVALDDFNLRPRGDDRRLLEIADIVKVDFLASDPDERARYARDLRPYGVTLLAEKVETRQDLDEAMQLGYSYFQGYYLARPEIRAGRRATGFRASRLQIIHELQKQDPDLRQVEEMLKRDPGLAFKLIRYLNSAAFSLRSRVPSVGRAITFLGQAGLRAWATIMILADVGTDRPFELVVSSVVRARFCELIGAELDLGEGDRDLFLMGLFSMIDAITGVALADAIVDLPFTDDVRAALLGTDNVFRTILDLARAYERADWATAGAHIERLGIRPEAVPACYLDAVDWGNQTTYLR